MPFVNIKVNQGLSDRDIAELTSTAVETIQTALQKPKIYICVNVEVSHHLTFAGTKDPAAVVTIQSIGFGGNSKQSIIDAMNGVLDKLASVPSDRCFVLFYDLKHSEVGFGGSLLG